MSSDVKSSIDWHEELRPRDVDCFDPPNKRNPSRNRVMKLFFDPTTNLQELTGQKYDSINWSKTVAYAPSFFVGIPS